MEVAESGRAEVGGSSFRGYLRSSSELYVPAHCHKMGLYKKSLSPIIAELI